MTNKKEKNLQTFKKGFTLAEVLITLGIIGVVAAMTIPTLMVDINTKQWATAADVFEKKLNEAMKNMNTAQVISGHSTTLSFVQELGNHFKINKICRNDELQNCFPEIIYWGAGEATPQEVDMKKVKQASHFGLQDWGTELIGVQFANGVAGLVAYNPTCSGDPLSNIFKGSECISMLYDVSGNKNPNTKGKDIGNFGIISKLGNFGCAFELSGTCFTAPFIPEPLSKEECIAMGLSACESSNVNYWAGAVKACGGINKVITPTQLAEIANYIYGTTDIGASTNKYDLTRDDSKATSLGFTIDTYGDFWIWSNAEANNFQSMAYLRYFGPTFTQYENAHVHEYDAQVVCIGSN